MTNAWERDNFETEQLPAVSVEQESIIALYGLALVSSSPEAADEQKNPAVTVAEITQLKKPYVSERAATQVSTDGVKQYLNRIGMHPLLTKDEVRLLSQTIEKRHDVTSSKDELAETVEKGLDVQERLNEYFLTYETASDELRQVLDEAKYAEEQLEILQNADDAKKLLIQSNLRLVVSIAKRYPLPATMEMLDLVQEGNLGLEHAVDKFDWKKGFEFSTYATFWIRQAIGRAIDHKGPLVRLPDHRSTGLRAALREVGGDEEKLSEEQARLHRLITPVSLNRSVGEDNDVELVDMISDQVDGPEQTVLDSEESELVTILLNQLPKRDAEIVIKRFGLDDGRDKSYRLIAEDYDITAEAVRRIVKRSLALLRVEGFKFTI